MRRLPMLALTIGLIVPFSPAAHATGTVTASMGVSSSRDIDGGRLVVVTCRGASNVPDTVSVSVTCTIGDTTATVWAPGPTSVAVVAAYVPLSPCPVASVSVTATFIDGTSATSELAICLP